MRFLTLGLLSAIALTCSVVACSDDDVSPASPTADGGDGDGGDSNSTPDGGGAGDTGTGSDSGSDSGGSRIGPGPYALVYTGFTVGIDGRAVADGKATFSGLTLTGYTATGQETNETPQIGTNTAKDVAGGPLFAICAFRST